MNSSSFIVAFLWLVGPNVSFSQTPIPAKPLGYTYLSPSDGQSPKVVLEIFYDHLCSDSKANWVFMKEVLQNLSHEQVTAIMHIFPLPYHHNAYFAQQVGVVVRQEAADFKGYIQLIFDNQDKFVSGAVNMTEPQVQHLLASLTAKSLGIDEEKIVAGFKDEVVGEKARYAYDYAAYRSVSGTPIFMVNGVISSEAGGYGADQWEQFIRKLLNASF